MWRSVIVAALCGMASWTSFGQERGGQRVRELVDIRDALGEAGVKDFCVELSYRFLKNDKRSKLEGKLYLKRTDAEGDYSVRFEGKVWPEWPYADEKEEREARYFRRVPPKFWDCTMLLDERGDFHAKSSGGEEFQLPGEPSVAQLEVLFAQLVRLPKTDWYTRETTSGMVFEYSWVQGWRTDLGRIEIRSVRLGAQESRLFSGEKLKEQIDWRKEIANRNWLALPRNPVEPADVPNACRPVPNWPPGRWADVVMSSENVGDRYPYGRHDVHLWAASGMTAELRETVTQSPRHSFDVWRQDGFGFTPLHYAAANGHRDAVRFLLANPMQGLTDGGNVLQNIELCSHNTMSPLHLAAIHGHAAVVEELLKVGVAVDAKDYRGNTALEYAAAAGQEEAILALLPKAKERAAGSIVQAVLCAIYANQPKSLRALSRGVDLKRSLYAEGGNEGFAGDRARRDQVQVIRLGPGATPLHYAAQAGKLDVVRFLVKEAGCSATCFNDQGQTPLFFAANGAVASFLIGEDPEIVNVLDRKRQTAAHSLAARNVPDALHVVIEKSPKLALAADEEGRQPLAYAVYHGSADSAELLIKAGADPKGRVNDEAGIAGLLGWGVTKLAGREFSDWILSENSSLLHIAARTGDQAMTKLLVSSGLEVDVRDACGRTPLLVAIQHGRVEYALWLLSGDSGLPKRPEANARSVTGVEPIHLAVKLGNMKLVEVLLERGADINARVPTEASISAIADLTSAIKSCHPGILWGSTPLDIARSKNQWEVAEYLRRRGAKEASELEP